MSRNSPAAKPPSRHVEDLLEEGPVSSNFQARGSPGLLASPLPPPGNRKGRSCVIQRRQNPGGQVSQGPREDAHDLIPRVVLCQPVLVDDEDGESQDRPVFVSQDVPAQHLEALVAVGSHGHAVAPQPDAGHGLWADSKGSGRGCMLLELAGLEVAPVAKGLISSTLLVHDREHLVGEQHGQHGPDVLLLFAVEHHGFEPVQWGPVGVLAQVGPKVLVLLFGGPKNKQGAMVLDYSFGNFLVAAGMIVTRVIVIVVVVVAIMLEFLILDFAAIVIVVVVVAIMIELNYS